MSQNQETPNTGKSTTESLEIQKDNLQGNSAFSSMSSFKDAQRMATALSSSSIVPSAYQNNVPNTLVALEMATRIGISPIFVMQNLDIIKGKPSWKSSFIIAALNSSGRFKPLRFKFEGDDSTADDFGCRAFSYDLETGDKITGPKVTWAMVKSEGWLSKPGSKWKTMPELMFQYRAASFFGRLHAPDILTGMHSVEENMDINSENMKDQLTNFHHNELKEYYESNNFDLEDLDREHIERIIENKESLSFNKVMKVLKSKIITDG